MQSCSNLFGAKNVIEITLPSVTVFWEDLGLPPRSQMSSADDRFMMRFWDDNLGPWLEQNAKGHVNPWEKGVWFADGKDAMLFKLTWAGQIPLSG